MTWYLIERFIHGRWQLWSDRRDPSGAFNTSDSRTLATAEKKARRYAHFWGMDIRQFRVVHVVGDFGEVVVDWEGYNESDPKF